MWNGTRDAPPHADIAATAATSRPIFVMTPDAL
jgi:hypothetical protein